MPINLPPGVSLRPNSAARNRVQPTGDFIPFSVRAAVGQTNDLFVAYASDGVTKLARVTSIGSVLQTMGSISADATVLWQIQGERGFGTVDFAQMLGSGSLTLRDKFGNAYFSYAGGIISSTASIRPVDVHASAEVSAHTFQGFSFSTHVLDMDQSGLAAQISSTTATDILFRLRGAVGQTGKAFEIQQTSSTTANRTVADIDAVFVDATDATRKSRALFSVYDTAAREALRLEASGSAAMIGFLGASAIVQQPSTADLKDAWCGFGFQVNGGATPLNLDGGSMTAANYATAIATKIADYTLTAMDGTILGDATTGGFSVTLPTAVGITGRVYVVKKIDTGPNLVTVVPNGAETIDGSASAAIRIPETALALQSDGAVWRII